MHTGMCVCVCIFMTKDVQQTAVLFLTFYRMVEFVSYTSVATYSHLSKLKNRACCYIEEVIKTMTEQHAHSAALFKHAFYRNGTLDLNAGSMPSSGCTICSTDIE